MTTQIERNIAQSRGRQMAAPASASRVRALESYGFGFTYIDDDTVIVERDYVFNLKASFWRRIDDPECHGYLVATLAAEIARRSDVVTIISEKPAAGRDSGPAPGETHIRQTSLPASAESAAGPLAPEAPSTTASLLPEIWR